VIALFTSSIAPIWLLAGALSRAGLPPGSGQQDADLVVVADHDRATQLHQPGQPL
jgi:hypothetical protein